MSEQLSALLFSHGLLSSREDDSQTGYHRVMLKSSHHYTSVLHYQVNPTPQDKIREIFGRCILATWPVAHKASGLLHSLVISLNEV